MALGNNCVQIALWDVTVHLQVVPLVMQCCIKPFHNKKRKCEKIAEKGGASSNRMNAHGSELEHLPKLQVNHRGMK